MTQEKGLESVTLTGDEVLVAAAKERDADAFSTLVQRYERRVYNLALRMMGNREDAEDVLQDTFLRVWDALPRFEGRSAFGTWLYRIAANSALMRLRKRGRNEGVVDKFMDDTSLERLQESGPGPSWSIDPEKSLLDGETLGVIKKAISELPPEYRIVLLLRDVEGLSAKEAARALDLSVPALKSRLHRARVYIRGKLTAYLEEEKAVAVHEA